MMNGPQRGRRSQHGGRSANRASSGNRRNGNVETELGAEYAPASPGATGTATKSGGNGATSANNDPHAMESGFFNKYAAMSDDEARAKNDAPADQSKSVILNAFERSVETV